MRLPSLFGLAPRSDVRIAFSMAGKADLSYGWMTSSCASGADMPASDFSGVGDP